MKTELSEKLNKKIGEHITIANLHMKTFRENNDEYAYRAATERMGRAFEDIEIMFSLELITIEEAIKLQERVSHEILG